MTLQLEGVVKHYVDEDEVVRAADGVSLRIDLGEMVVLTGPSGAGKTTLLLIACGLMRPDAGRVTFDGRDLVAMSEREAADFRREEVGCLFQSFNLQPGMPADENGGLKLIVDRVPFEDARRQAGRWLSRVGLGRKRGRLPSQLSGGERQRVALVRALVTDPRLVVADEPTAHLHAEKANEIFCLLRDFARKQHAVVLVVSHDPQAVAIADRAFALRDGRLAPAEGAA